MSVRSSNRKPNDRGTTLLARAAEYLYWAGRYLERAEDAARVVNVHGETHFDMPVGEDVGWSPLLEVTGSGSLYEERFGSLEHSPLPTGQICAEDRIIRFVLIDRDNPSSLLSSIAQARSNLRQARSVVPREVWELCNELWAALTQREAHVFSRDTRARWLRLVVDECYRINGVLLGTMRHDEALTFLRMGQQLERAEMTCRVLAVRATNALAGLPFDSYQDAHHMAILRSLASYQPFQRTGPTGLKTGALLRFLIQDDELPRSVKACLGELHGLLSTLPDHGAASLACTEAVALITPAPITDLSSEGLRTLLDRTHQAIAGIHDRITMSFFTATRALASGLPAEVGTGPSMRVRATSPSSPEPADTIAPMAEERVWRVTHATIYEYDGPVDYSYNEAHLRPRDADDQRCLEHRLEVTPEPTGLREFVDPFGNWVTVFSVRGKFDRLSVTATSEVARTAPAAPPPGLPWESVRKILDIDRQPAAHDARRYRASSRTVPTSTMFAEYAAESFRPCRPLVEAAIDLSTRIHRDFVYEPGFTSIATPLSEVFEHRRGVCQDFAHLMIACLRSIGLASRYVSGYILTTPSAGFGTFIGADASHAWASIYLPGWGWVDIDPTNDQLVGQSHVITAWGRDYCDVSPLRGSVEGGGRSHHLDVAVDVRPLVGA